MKTPTRSMTTIAVTTSPTTMDVLLSLLWDSSGPSSVFGVVNFAVVPGSVFDVVVFPAGPFVVGIGGFLVGAAVVRSGFDDLAVAGCCAVVAACGGNSVIASVASYTYVPLVVMSGMSVIMVVGMSVDSNAVVPLIVVVSFVSVATVVPFEESLGAAPCTLVVSAVVSGSS